MDHVAISRVLALSDAGVWGPDAGHDGISILRSTNFRADGDISFDNLAIKEIAQKDRIRKLLLPGDILVEKSGGGPKQPVGRVAFFRGSARHHVFGNFIARLRVRPDVCDPRFLFWFLHVGHQRGVTENFQKQTTGIRNLELKRFLGQKMPLPPLDEQRRIVGLLDRAAEIRRRADAARAKARAIIPALFLDTFGDPATNPKGWPVNMVGDAGEVKLGRQRAPKYQSGKFTRPYVRVANVFENRIDVSDLLSMDFDERDYANYRLSYGDILLNEGQSLELVGRPAMWRDEVMDCCFQNTLVRFRCDLSKIVPDFALAAFLRMYHDGHLSKIASKTSNVAHLGAGRFLKLPIVLPPLQLQNAFAEQSQRLESLARHLDAAAAKAEAMAAGLSAEVFGSTKNRAENHGLCHST